MSFEKSSLAYFDQKRFPPFHRSSQNDAKKSEINIRFLSRTRIDCENPVHIGGFWKITH